MGHLLQFWDDMPTGIMFDATHLASSPTVECIDHYW